MAKRRIRRIPPGLVNTLDDTTLGAFVRILSLCDDAGKVYVHCVPFHSQKHIAVLSPMLMHIYNPGHAAIVHVVNFPQMQAINRPSMSAFPPCVCENNIISDPKILEGQFTDSLNSLNRGMPSVGIKGEKPPILAVQVAKKDLKDTPKEWEVLFPHYNWTPPAMPILMVCLNLTNAQFARYRRLLARYPELWIAHALEVHQWYVKNNENRMGPMMAARIKGNEKINTPADIKLQAAKEIFKAMTATTEKGKQQMAKTIKGIIENMPKEGGFSGD